MDLDWDSGVITVGPELERQVATFLETVDQSKIFALKLPGYHAATARIGSAKDEDWGGPGLQGGPFAKPPGGASPGGSGGSGWGSAAALGSGGGLPGVWPGGLPWGLGRVLSGRGLARGLSGRGLAGRGLAAGGSERGLPRGLPKGVVRGLPSGLVVRGVAQRAYPYGGVFRALGVKGSVWV